ncbi:MAG: acyltransferase family protein, partial [Hyphomonadaceae bacterium]
MEKERFLALDGLRGIAAVAVLLRHFGSAAGPVRLPESYLAVDLFFLLSGFVLAHAYEQRLRAGMSFWDFLKARFIRLYPLYFLGTAIGAAGAFWLASRNWGHAEFGEMLGSLSFNLAFLPSAFHEHNPFPYNGPAWSLFYEMLASVIFALAAPLMGPRA